TCRTRPARMSNWCEGTTASEGISLDVGMKNRDQSMTILSTDPAAHAGKGAFVIVTTRGRQASRVAAGGPSEGWRTRRCLAGRDSRREWCEKGFSHQRRGRTSGVGILHAAVHADAPPRFLH